MTCSAHLPNLVPYTPQHGLSQGLATAVCSGSKQRPGGPWALLSNTRGMNNKGKTHILQGKQTVSGQKWTQFLAKNTVSMTIPTLPHLALYKPELRAAWQLSTILAQTTSIVSAGLRSDTKTPRNTRASSGKRSSRCSRSSCSGHRVICASCFWTSLALICMKWVSNTWLPRPRLITKTPYPLPRTYPLQQGLRHTLQSTGRGGWWCGWWSGWECWTRGPRASRLSRAQG